MKFDDIQFSVNGLPFIPQSEFEVMRMRLVWLAEQLSTMIVGDLDYLSIRCCCMHEEFRPDGDFPNTDDNLHVLGITVYRNNIVPDGNYYDERMLLIC